MNIGKKDIQEKEDSEASLARRDLAREKAEAAAAQKRTKEWEKSIEMLPPQECAGPVVVYRYPDCRFLVFGANEAYTLRMKYRISGSLVGGFPLFRQQVISSGLPMLLLPEEVSLGLRKGWIKLAEASVAWSVKREVRPPLPPVVAKIAEKGVPKIARKGAKVVQLRHLSLADSEHELCPPTKVQFPISALDKVKEAVYADLWNKGFYVSCGAKFGGTYLVYPGDPLLFHSYFIVLCVTENEQLMNLGLATLGRLGVTCKKASCLASLVKTVEGQEVQYLTLDWEGTA